MAKVKIGFKDLPVPKQIERSRLILTRMADNIHFASPNPPLADVAAATNALETAYNQSRGRDRVLCALMRLRRKKMLELIAQLSAYVQNASASNLEIILSSGFDVIGRGSPLPPVTLVLNVRVKDGKVSGAVKLQWNKVTGAKIYLVRVMLNPEQPTDADIKATPSCLRCEVEGLTPGKRYYIQVAAIGGGMIGSWSNAVSKIMQ